MIAILVSVQGDTHVLPGSWTPDGKVFAYSVVSGPSDDSYAIEPQGDAQSRLILGSPANEHQPSFSPDGRWLAYVSDESGIDEVYVNRLPALGKEFKSRPRVVSLQCGVGTGRSFSTEVKRRGK